MKSISLFATAALSFVLVACGGPLRYEVVSNAKAPGADATIVADVKPEQHATALEIEVKNLAPPDRVAEGATDYIVWQRSSSSVPWSRVGGLVYDPGARSGQFQGSVPETAFDLQVTAEKAVDVASPSPDAVLSKHVN